MISSQTLLEKDLLTFFIWRLNFGNDHYLGGLHEDMVNTDNEGAEGEVGASLHSDLYFLTVLFLYTKPATGRHSHHCPHGALLDGVGLDSVQWQWVDS